MGDRKGEPHDWIVQADGMYLCRKCGEMTHPIAQRRPDDCPGEKPTKKKLRLVKSEDAGKG